MSRPPPPPPKREPPTHHPIHPMHPPSHLHHHHMPDPAYKEYRYNPGYDPERNVMRAPEDLSKDEQTLFMKQQSAYNFDAKKAMEAQQAMLQAQLGLRPPPGEAGDAKKKVAKVAVRNAAGKTWIDETMEQWPEGDFRLFVGNIGNEVTDELLSHSFGRYPSLARTKVIRDKHTNKSKGFAFISFMDPFDCAKALREMHGKYIGNRPCKLSRSTWNDRTLAEVRKTDKKKAKQLKNWGIKK